MYWKKSYHGTWPKETPPPGYITREAVVVEGRRLLGIAYDPLMGKAGNIGGRVGFIVCVDVPVLAYWNAGYSLKSVLEEDFKKHPQAYDTRDGNQPGNPFFHRRARNVYAYCLANRTLLMAGQKPRPGDVVFYARRPGGAIIHIALISDVREDGSYAVIEASPELWWTREVPSKDTEGRSWVPIGIGRLI